MPTLRTLPSSDQLRLISHADKSMQYNIAHYGVSPLRTIPVYCQRFLMRPFAPLRVSAFLLFLFKITHVLMD